MHAFATLLEALVLTPSRNGKLRLIDGWLATQPDPDRGYGLAAMAGTLDLPAIKGAGLRALAAERTDAELFALSHDFVGDLAETIALIWPADHGRNAEPPSLAEAVDALRAASRREAPQLVAGWLDAMGPAGRFALLKLVTGGLRVGVSARLLKQALAARGQVPVEEIEELWPAQTPPYHALLAFIDGTGPKPTATIAAPFRPVMLAHPADAADLAAISPRTHVAEWKWDGIRIQAVRESGITRLYSRTGDDITTAFPDLAGAMTVDGALDGELLVARHDGKTLVTGTFSDLQQRLNRKAVTRRQMEAFPAAMRCYDILHDGTRDLRGEPLDARRPALADLVARLDPARFDLSPLVTFAGPDDLARLRAAPPDPVIEGLMLKRLDSAYLAGRPKGPWFKWKRDPMQVDAVLMYAQRGHGKRSGFYSDYTFGVWDGEPGLGGQLVPVGKAYSGFTDEELKKIDRFVRDNTVDRFGPVRSVRAGADFGLVFEVAFEGLNASTRHKSGVAMRFPRIARIRWDKPSREADRLKALTALIG